MKNRKDDGMITLEACVSVLIFMTLMLIILGLFQMFMAQNATSHCMVETAESLSLDSYATSKLRSDSWNNDIGTHISNFIAEKAGSPEENPSFVTDSAWCKGEGGSSLEEVIKTRFVGYLTGGDENEADELLENLRVVDGLDGLDFSDSKIVNGDLRIILKYELEYSFKIWDLGVVPVTQKAVSRMWAENADTINLD